MVKSWILPLKCKCNLPTAIKGETLLLKVTVSASPRVAHEHGQILLPTGWGLSRQQSWGLRLWPVLINVMSAGSADCLGQGQFPKWQQGMAALLKSWDKWAGSWFIAWQVLAKKQEWNSRISRRVSILASCPLGEIDSESSFDFFFFKSSMLMNCPLRHQELDKAERSWLISSLAGEQRWRQSFLSTVPVVLSPKELKNSLGTFSLISDSSLSCSKMFKKTYTP